MDIDDIDDIERQKHLDLLEEELRQVKLERDALRRELRLTRGMYCEAQAILDMHDKISTTPEEVAEACGWGPHDVTYPEENT